MTYGRTAHAQLADNWPELIFVHVFICSNLTFERVTKSRSEVKIEATHPHACYVLPVIFFSLFIGIPLKYMNVNKN
jgi:hypothetical protein